ncbi:hypothetical protein BS47DRAFT_466546 [Hydnum rufescens UP504]|uniref:Uncharacterized protein n=1 Tax=Hydnum rufescens UP504 TaxID=1448309 RepID=A0A9P6DWM2_9AGAM|nr:hypothetical protein BS47DRAFT_466546 [Hydnum rufescens UP504]
MGWDNISGDENRASPAQVSGDATLRFDQMLMTDSFLLDEHSYDNYLDDLDEQDVSFAVPPFASSTPATQKKNSRQLEASKSRLVQLRGPATAALPAQVPLTAHTPRIRRANAATEDLATRKGPSDLQVTQSTKRAIDISGLPGPGPGKENVYSPQPNTHTPLDLQVRSQPIIKPITVDKPASSHIPHPQSTLNSTRGAVTGIPRPRLNQISSAIGSAHSRTNSTSGIPGLSATTKATTHPSLSSRLVEAFSAFDSLTEPVNPATLTIVGEPIPAIHVTSNSHHNTVIDESLRRILTRDELHSGPPAASTSTLPAASGPIHSNVEMNPLDSTRNMDNALRRTSLIMQDGDPHAPHLDAPIQNDQRSVTEWASRHSNPYPGLPRSPTSKVPPGGFVEERVGLSAVPFPTPKGKETAAFPDKPVPSSVLSPPSALSYETRGSFAPAYQPLLPSNSSASSLLISRPKPATPEDEVTDIVADSNDPDEMFTRQPEGIHHSLVRHQLSDGMANPLISDASSKIQSDQFVALEPESIQATEPTSVFAISSLAESIPRAPPQGIKRAVISDPGVSDSPRVRDTENQGKGEVKEINQDFIKSIGVQKKSSGGSAVSRRTKAVTEVPNWVHPVTPRANIESDHTTTVTQATFNPSHDPVVSSSTMLHSEFSESATDTALKPEVPTQAQSITRAQSATSVSKSSVPSSTISSRTRTRTLSKQTVPFPPKSTILPQKIITTSEPQSAIVSSIRPKEQPRGTRALPLSSSTCSRLHCGRIQ